MGGIRQGRRSYWSTKRSVNVVGGMGFDVLRVDGYATNKYEDEEVVVEEQLAVHEGEEDVGKKISGRNTPRRKGTRERSVLVDKRSVNVVGEKGLR